MSNKVYENDNSAMDKYLHSSVDGSIKNFGLVEKGPNKTNMPSCAGKVQISENMNSKRVNKSKKLAK